MVADVCASLVPASTPSGAELSSWRQPVDLVVPLFGAYDGLGLNARSGTTRTRRERCPPDGLDETLLGDDPHAVVDALCDATRAGATSATLVDRVCHAAAARSCFARSSAANGPASPVRSAVGRLPDPSRSDVGPARASADSGSGKSANT